MLCTTYALVAAYRLTSSTAVHFLPPLDDIWPSTSILILRFWGAQSSTAMLTFRANQAYVESSWFAKFKSHRVNSTGTNTGRRRTNKLIRWSYPDLASFQLSRSRWVKERESRALPITCHDHTGYWLSRLFIRIPIRIPFDWSRNHCILLLLIEDSFEASTWSHLES